MEDQYPQVKITIFKDVNCVHQTAARKSTTGILLLIKTIPIKWISKMKQKGEKSTYGS